LGKPRETKNALEQGTTTASLTRKRPFIAAILFVCLLIVTDQVIKAWVIAHIPLGFRLDLVNHLALYHAQNSGIAFSMLSSFDDWALIILTLLVIGFVIYMWWIASTTKNPFTHGGYLLILGGAFGNLIDRLRFHYVTDYILFYIGEWSFAVFNIADTFITIGAFIIICHEIISLLRDGKIA